MHTYITIAAKCLKVVVLLFKNDLSSACRHVGTYNGRGEEEEEGGKGRRGKKERVGVGKNRKRKREYRKGGKC